MRCHLFLCVLIGCILGWCASPASAEAAGSLVQHQWKVDGVERTGAIWTPTGTPKSPRPLVFVFHGHGGGSVQAERAFGIEQSWPEAVVVYLQGLPTAGVLTDHSGKLSGWDMNNGVGANRDIAFFDVVLADVLKDPKVDPNRVYVTGHSNGGGFVYVLWATRGDKIAAVAPSGSLNAKFADQLSAKPVLLIGGRNDNLVKWSWQERMMDHVKKLNQSAGKGEPWGKNGTWYASTGSEYSPTAIIAYDGGHRPPSDTGQRVADFFKRCEAESAKQTSPAAPAAK